MTIDLDEVIQEALDALEGEEKESAKPLKNAVAKGKSMSWKEGFLELLSSFKAAATTPEDELGSSDLRAQLEQALYASQPAFLGVVEVFPDSQSVVYATAPEGVPQLFRQSFSFEGDELELVDDLQEVEETRKYEALGAAPRAACSCSSSSSNSEGGEMKKKQLVASLIASLKDAAGKPVFSESDAAQLEAFSEERLLALKTAAEAEPEEEEEEEEEEEGADAKKRDASASRELSREDVLKQFPDLAVIVSEHQARTAARKAELIKLVTAARSDAWSESELAAKDVSELEKLAKFVAASSSSPARIDQSGRALPGAKQQEDSIIPPPPSLKARILESRKQQGAA